MTTREEFYEVVVKNFTREEFYRTFGVEPLDIQDFDYNFSQVKWTASLEYFYNIYVAEEEFLELDA